MVQLGSWRGQEEYRLPAKAHDKNQAVEFQRGDRDVLDCFCTL